MQLLTEVDLGEVTERVGSSMLGFDIVFTDEPYVPAHDVGRLLVGCVQIASSVDAAAIVEVPAALAARVGVIQADLCRCEAWPERAWPVRSMADAGATDRRTERVMCRGRHEGNRTPR